MAQQQAASAATAGADPAFRVVVNIDITGSMAAQLEGVKAYCAELATLCRALDAPISFVIITFTESSKGCYVSMNEFQDLDAARTFVEGLKLCCPPSHPEVTDANGGDGDENHKAALYQMVELDPSVPTISFLITDAGPHFRSASGGREARQELAWLADKDLPPQVAADIQRVFGLVLDHYAGSLVQNVVYYGTDTQLQTFYGSLAQRTGGMLMCTRSNDSRLLAGGLLHVIKSLLTHLVPEAGAGAGAQAEEGLDPLSAFQLFDLAQLQPVETEEEQERLGTVQAGDKAAIFEIAMERMVAVCGSKWSKRAKGMSAPGQQLTFVGRAARYIATPPTDPTAAAEELAALVELRGQILEALPEADRGHFSIQEADLRGRLRDWYQSMAAGPAGVSAISLASVGDMLAEEADWEDVLADVAQLLLGYPLKVQVPLDREGRPDFMDAWSSRLEGLGCDVISSADFLRLIGDAPAAVGPTDRKEHNAFLVTASPSDPLASLVLRVASGTQVLNYITGVCLGAKGFLPNLYPGVAAATLVSVLDQERLNQFQWHQAQELLHCLSTLHHAPSRALLESLQAGRANPEDPVSKMVAAAARLRGRAAASNGVSTSSSSDDSALRGVLKLMLQEWLLGMVQRAYGRRDEEGTAEYLRVVGTYLPADLLLVVPAAMDPLQQLHPLEKPAAAAIAADLRPGWEAAAHQRIMQGAADAGTSSAGGTKVAPLGVIRRFERAARRLVTLLLGSHDSAASRSGEDSLLPVSSVWPEWEQAVLQALLLRWRTARYTSSQAEEKEGASSGTAAKPAAVVWTPVEQLPPTEELLLQRLSEVHASDIKGWRAARLAAAEEALMAAAVNLLQQHAEDEQALNAGLAQLFLQLTPGAHSSTRAADAPRGPLAVLLDVTARLERKAVPQLLQQLAAGPTQAQLTVLLTGDWSTLPTSALKRSSEVLAAVQAAGRADLEEALAARDKCCRTKGANRHGHTIELQYPGPTSWSAEYAAERLRPLVGRAHERAQRYLGAMQRYTEMAAAARAAAGGTKQLAAVEQVLGGVDDANELPRVLVKVEGVLGQKLPL